MPVYVCLFAYMYVCVCMCALVCSLYCVGMQQYGSTPYCVLLLTYCNILPYCTRCSVTISFIFMYMHSISVESHNQAIQFDS